MKTPARTFPQAPAQRTAAEHAAALVAAIGSLPGAPRLRVWSAAGVGTRVYFPSGQYVSIGRGGEVAATMRGAQTFDEKSLYPAQRRAFRDGLAIYLMQLKAYFEAQGREGNPVGKKSKLLASTNAQRFEADVEKHLPRGVDVDFRTDPSSENWAQIDQIAAATPGKGHGSRAMEIICAKADEYDIRLQLIVEADDEEDDEAEPVADRLIRWYGRYGFFVTGLSSWGDNVLVRKPGALRHPVEREARKGNPVGKPRKSKGRRNLVVADEDDVPEERRYDLAEAERVLGVHISGAVLGCGQWGCAAPLANGRVLKVTTDEAEVMAIEAVYDARAFDGFVRIDVPPTRLPGGSFAYVREPIEPAGDKDEEAVRSWSLSGNGNAGHDDLSRPWSYRERIKSTPKNIAATLTSLRKKGVLLYDVTPENVGRGQDGRLVIFDARGEKRVERKARKGNPTRRASPGEPLFDVEVMVQRPRHRADGDEVPEIRKPEHGQKLYRGKKVAWIGEPGRMLKLGWDQVKPVQGNIFDPAKVAGFYKKLEAAAAAGKTMTFSAPPAWLFFVNHDDVAQTQYDARHRPMDLEYERLTRPYTTGDDELDAHLAAVLADDPGGALDPADRARVKAAERKKKGDLGQVKAQLRDANHRAFAAQLAGEPYLWVQVATGEENGFDPKKLA